MSKKKSTPAWGNASADPLYKLPIPLNRAARRRFQKAKGLEFMTPALNTPRVNPERRKRKQGT